jgi:hypothetical protein
MSSSIDTFGRDNPNGCKNCLVPKSNILVPFCDTEGNCLVTMQNTSAGTGTWTHDCYIEVFFIGKIVDQTLPPPPSIDSTDYKGSTIISSLRWSATAEFMNNNAGYMLNCVNHTS